MDQIKRTSLYDIFPKKDLPSPTGSTPPQTTLLEGENSSPKGIGYGWKGFGLMILIVGSVFAAYWLYQKHQENLRKTKDE